MKPGSVKMYFKGSEGAIKKIKAFFENQELKSVLGFEVL